MKSVEGPVGHVFGAFIRHALCSHPTSPPCGCLATFAPHSMQLLFIASSSLPFVVADFHSKCDSSSGFMQSFSQWVLFL